MQVDPFRRFSDDSKLVVQLAQEEAERSHHNYIGTEHLLLAMLRVQPSTANKVLTDMGIDIEQVRGALRLLLGRNERTIVDRIIPTSRVKHVIELSFEEARRMGSETVETGHLLVGLVQEDGIASQVLTDLAATPDRVIDAVRDLMEYQSIKTFETSQQVIDPQLFRDVMSTFPSGVVIVTAFGEDGLPRGLTVSAFCAVSLDPALVLVCIDKTSNTLPAVQHTQGFTANILAAGREALARHMATKVSDKFEGIEWHRSDSQGGGPILSADTAAYAVCSLQRTIEGGDHWILIGNVLEGRHQEGVAPMVFSRRGYHRL